MARTSNDSDVLIQAKPYQARQCPECDMWIFTDAAPFGEGDRTKTVRDFIHYENHHMTEEERSKMVIGIPSFQFNDQPVTAVLEEA